MARRGQRGIKKPVADAMGAAAEGDIPSKDGVEDRTTAHTAPDQGQEAHMEGDCDKLYFEMASKVYAGIQEQIRFADTKAGFVAAFNAILVGFTATDLSTIKDIYRATHDLNACIWLVVLSLITGVPTAVSIAYLIWAVRPRLGKNTRRSRIFFGHIARDYHLDGLRYRDDARAMSQGDWADDYGYQIVEVANIAQEKHSNVRTSMNWSFGAFVALVIISLVVHTISVFYLPTTSQPTGQPVSPVPSSTPSRT